MALGASITSKSLLVILWSRTSVIVKSVSTLTMLVRIRAISGCERNEKHVARAVSGILWGNRRGGSIEGKEFGSTATEPAQ